MLVQLENLNFDQLWEGSQNFRITPNDSYVSTYPEFIRYFEEINEIKKHHLMICSHFVYGWMPTVLKLNLSSIEDVLKALNKAKKGIILTEDELSKIKGCINNSMVGTSKLLHFINPNEYAIWDSRIFRYATLKKSTYGIDSPSNYLLYLKTLKEIATHKQYESLHLKVEKLFQYRISPMRAIEVLMFETDRIHQRGEK